MSPLRVGLVGCGSRKLGHAAPARDLYTGGLFRAASSYAEATYDEWFILSAAHELVDPDEELHPYDYRLSELRQSERGAWGGRTASRLRRRLHDQGISVPIVPRGRRWWPHEPQVRIFIHAGKDYVRALSFDLHLFPCDVVVPLEGLGIGQQLRWYAEHRKAAAGEGLDDLHQEGCT